MITHLVSALLLPPLDLLLVAGLGAALLRSAYASLGRVLIWLALILLYILSMPLTGQLLMRTLETPSASIAQQATAQAIVVLGNGIYRNPAQFGGDSVQPGTLERLRLAARLQRAYHLPILVSGGSSYGGTPESVAMWDSLREDFAAEVRWMETLSHNTAENAKFSRAILQPYQVDRILLVTHAWHMPRARMAFEKAGFTVIPAATGYAHGPWIETDLLPSAKGLAFSYLALHEWIGLVWYRLTGSG